MRFSVAFPMFEPSHLVPMAQAAEETEPRGDAVKLTARLFKD